MSHITLMLENYLKRNSTFIRFLLVGLINTAISFSIIFILMNLFEQGYWLSTFLGNGAGIVSSFLLNRAFTFKSSISIWRGSIPFLLVVTICYIGSYSLSERIAYFYFSFARNYQKELAVVIGMFFYTLSNYFGQKLFVFKE